MATPHNPVSPTQSVPPPPPTRVTATALQSDPVVVPPLCWGAIIAGAVAALSVHILVTLFGVGLGLHIVDPVTDAEPMQKFSIGVGIAWAVSALIALFTGGWVAGRFAPDPGRGLGGLHGFLVWCLATVTLVLVLAGGARMLVGGIANLTGSAVQGVAAAAQPALEAGGDALGDLARQHTDVINSFVNELVPGREGGGDTAAQQAAAATARATREITWSLYRYFSQDRAERTQAERDALAATIAEHTPLDQPSAAARVDEMSATYERMQRQLQEMKDEAAIRAREAADTTANYLKHAAVWTFVAFLIGAIAASLGGAAGARSRALHDVGAPHGSRTL
jgi:hypothetical protein